MRTRQSAKSPRVQKERIVCAPWSRRFDQWEQRDVGSPLHRRRDRASSPPSPSSSQQYLDPPIAFYLVSSYGRSCSSTTTSTTPPTVNLLATIWKRLPLRGATVGNDVRAITQVRVVYLTLNTRGKEGREVRNSKGRENWRRRRTISLLCDSSRYFFLNGMNGVAEMLGTTVRLIIPVFGCGDELFNRELSSVKCAHMTIYVYNYGSLRLVRINFNGNSSFVIRV